MQYWVLLLVAIVLEVLGATFMKLSHGFTRTIPLLLMLMFYGCGIALLTYVLRRLDISTVYAIWSGLGTALVAAIGFIWFREPVSLLKLVSIGLIILGVVGLSLQRVPS